MQMLRCFRQAQVCLWRSYNALFCFVASSLNSNTFCPYSSELHRHFAQSESMGVHTCFRWESSSHCRAGAPLCTTRHLIIKTRSVNVQMLCVRPITVYMLCKLHCANRYGSSDLIRLGHKWVVFVIASVFIQSVQTVCLSIFLRQLMKFEKWRI